MFLVTAKSVSVTDPISDEFVEGNSHVIRAKEDPSVRIVVKSSELESNGLHHVANSSSLSTVTYSNSVTVVTSTMPCQTVSMKKDDNEDAAGVTYTTGKEEPEERQEEQLNDINHIDTSKVKGDSIEGHLTTTEIFVVENSTGESSKGGSSKGGSSEVESSDIQVTNLDSMLTFSEAKVEDPTLDTYEVNDIMVTKI